MSEDLSELELALEEDFPELPPDDEEPDPDIVRQMGLAIALDGEVPLYRPAVPLEERERKRLCVLGCPRSGTKSFARVLQFFGLRIEHELMGEDGTVDCTFTVPRTLRDPANFSEKGLWQYRFDQTIQLVRHPLYVIASLQRELYPSWWTWQELHTGIAVEGGRPDAPTAARYWCWWTDQAHALAREQYVRLEDFGYLAPIANLGRRGKAAPVRWEELGVEMGAAVQARMLRYGYIAQGG